MTSLRFTDILYFFAELGVYVAVVWWGFTRDAPGAARWALGLGALVIFAVSWGLLAAPRASHALAGHAGVAFRVLWFGLGLAAALAVIIG